MGFADGSPVSKFINGKVNWSYKNICNAANLLNVVSLVFMDDIGKTLIQPKKIFKAFDSYIEILMQSTDLKYGVAKQKFHKSRSFSQSTIHAFCEHNSFCSLHILKGKMLINGEEQSCYTIHDDPDVIIYIEANSEVIVHVSNVNKELYLIFEKYLRDNAEVL